MLVFFSKLNPLYCFVNTARLSGPGGWVVVVGFLDL